MKKKKNNETVRVKIKVKGELEEKICVDFFVGFAFCFYVEEFAI